MMVAVLGAAAGLSGLAAEPDAEEMLTRVLERHVWDWVENGRIPHKQFEFHRDGTVVWSKGAAWNWKITGPRTVHFTCPKPADFMDMTLDETLSRFTVTNKRHFPTATGGWGPELTPAGMEAALTEALEAHAWTWVDYGQTGGKELRFRPDGTVTCSNGQTWKWKVTGPKSVHFTWRTAEEFMDMYLNDDLTHFACNNQKYQPTASGAWVDMSPAAGGADMQVVERASSAIEVFTKMQPAIMQWIAEPLDQPLLPGIHDTVVELRANLQEEAAAIPQASAEAYAGADRICYICAVAFETREKMIVQNPRDVPQPLNAAVLAKWEQMSVAYVNALDVKFKEFREAVRLSPAPRKVLGPLGISYVRLPGVPVRKNATILPGAMSHREPPKVLKESRVAVETLKVNPAKVLKPAPAPAHVAPHEVTTHRYIWTIHRPTM